jgi:hypothetical protein
MEFQCLQIKWFFLNLEKLDFYKKICFKKIFFERSENFDSISLWKSPTCLNRNLLSFNLRPVTQLINLFSFNSHLLSISWGVCHSNNTLVWYLQIAIEDKQYSLWCNSQTLRSGILQREANWLSFSKRVKKSFIRQNLGRFFSFENFYFFRKKTLPVDEVKLEKKPLENRQTD